MGGFNAHIGQSYSDRFHGQTNTQGHLLTDLMNRTGHFAVSLSDLAKGPMYTFFCGNKTTTVDYCLIDCWAAHLVTGCEVLDHHPLNLSDHLALTVNLDCKPHLLNPPEQAHPKLNWRKAILDGSIQEFQEYASSNLSPLLNHSLETIAEIDEEIMAVTSILHHAATETIPVIRNSTKVKNYIRDDELKQKCQRSKVAWHHWRNAGRPRSGPLYQNMKAAKYEVKVSVRKCRARQERKVIETRDEMFKNKHARRFNIHQKRSHCRKLIVDEKSVTEEDDLLKCWKNYFSNLAQTQAGNSDLSDLDISHMEAMSHGFEDLI